MPKRPCAQILGFGVGYPLSRGADSLAQCPSGTWAQTGRFPMVREGNFNCRAKGPEMAEICCQKAPSQVSVVGTGTHHVTSQQTHIRYTHTYRTRRHTLAQKQQCEFCCGMHLTCTKQSLKNCQENLLIQREFQYEVNFLRPCSEEGSDVAEPYKFTRK